MIHLPIEILLIIFLCDPSVYWNCRQVCSLFYNIINSFPQLFYSSWIEYNLPQYSNYLIYKYSPVKNRYLEMTQELSDIIKQWIINIYSSNDIHLDLKSLYLNFRNKYQNKIYFNLTQFDRRINIYLESIALNSGDAMYTNETKIINILLNWTNTGIQLYIEEDVYENLLESVYNDCIQFMSIYLKKMNINNQE